MQREVRLCSVVPTDRTRGSRHKNAQEAPSKHQETHFDCEDDQAQAQVTEGAGGDSMPGCIQMLWTWPWGAGSQYLSMSERVGQSGLQRSFPTVTHL